MITNALDHSPGSRVPHAEALCCNAPDVSLSLDSTVEADVAHDDVFFGLEDGGLGWVDRNDSTAETLSDIVV